VPPVQNSETINLKNECSTSHPS